MDGQVLIDPATQATEMLMSWRGDTFQELPAGTTVCIDGPGTSGNCHDEVLWLAPCVKADSFQCSFRLELHLEPQAGHPRDVGRHGGVVLGASNPWTDGRWPTPRAEMQDAVYIGWWPGDEGYWGKAFGKEFQWLVKPVLREQPEEWIIKADGHRLTVHLGGGLVCDFMVSRPLKGFIGFWRARSENCVTAHDLCVKIKGHLLLTLSTSTVANESVESNEGRDDLNTLAVRCISMGGECILSVNISPLKTVAELLALIMEGLGQPYVELGLLLQDGRRLDNHKAVLSDTLLA